MSRASDDEGNGGGRGGGDDDDDDDDEDEDDDLKLCNICLCMWMGRWNKRGIKEKRKREGRYTVQHKEITDVLRALDKHLCWFT